MFRASAQARRLGTDRGVTDVLAAEHCNRRRARGRRSEMREAIAEHVVLVVEEIFGVHEHIKDVCRRLAKLGYLAVAPELFARQGDPTKIADPQRINTDVVAKTPDREVMADLDATVAWVGKNGGDVGKLGITGFCWGGRIVWLYAAHTPRVKAGVAWYGRLDGARNDLQPHYPLDIAPTLQVPVLGLYGGQDGSIPLDLVERMRTALAAGPSHSEIVVYPAGTARLPRRLPSELPRNGRPGRLEAPARLVHEHGVV